MDKKKQFRKRNVLQKYFEYFKEKLLIALKEIKEYKSNSYTVLFVDVFVLLIYIIFFTVYMEVAGDFLKWTTYDLILYYLLTLIEWKMVWLIGLKDIKLRLIKGDFNVALNKPINPFIFFSLKGMNGATIFTIPPLILAIVVLLYIGDYANQFIGIMITLFGAIYFMLLYNLFESFAFFMKETGFGINVLQRTNSTVKRFTPVVFDGLKINFFYIVPGAVSGFFALSYLKGNTLFLNYIPYVLLSMMIVILLTITLWYYGLKRYEAYG